MTKTQKNELIEIMADTITYSVEIEDLTLHEFLQSGENCNNIMSQIQDLRNLLESFKLLEGEFDYDLRSLNHKHIAGDFEKLMYGVSFLINNNYPKTHIGELITIYQEFLIKSFIKIMEIYIEEEKENEKK